MSILTKLLTPLFLLTLLLSFTNLTFAQESCGTITDAGGSATPIEDCENPFNEDSFKRWTPRIIVGSTEVSSAPLVTFTADTSTTSIQLTYQFRPFSSFLDLYKKNGDDYVFVERVSQQSSKEIDVEAGDYTAVVVIDAGPMPSFEDSLLDQFFAWVLPVAQAFYPNGNEVHVFDFVIELEDTPPPPVPEIDPLILQYAPVLYMHPDEDYFPMNVEAFVEASALWEIDSPDTQVRTETDLTLAEFESIIENQNTEDMYLAFSDPENPRSIDVDNAKLRYDGLRTVKKATTTVYYHKMEDSFVDDAGETHEYIVLQYWFFYAMNNWGEHDGFNDHEGDWESVFIFLDKGTEDPQYVAFSSHLNDGKNEVLNLYQYDSVRKKWSDPEVNFVDEHLISFVSLGSHANYSNAGNHKLLTGTDQTSKSGQHIFSREVSLSAVKGNFSSYLGLWGTFLNSEGKNGPQGPQFINVTGQTRFEEPIIWAGIDKDAGIQISAPTQVVNFTKQKAKFVFEESVEAGTEILVALHEEIITFGENIAELDFLPNFWDISSNLENETFNTTVTFSYDDELVDLFDGAEEQITVFFYNEETDEWEEQESSVNTETNEVSYTTDHFSIYALGFVEPEEELSLSELFEQLRSEIKDTELRNIQKKVLLKRVRWAEWFAKKETKVGKAIAKKLLKNIERKIDKHYKKKNITKEDLDKISELLIQIHLKLD